MPGSELLAPIITGTLAVISIVVGGIITSRNRKRGAIEGRAPTAQQAWEEADQARGLMRWFEDRFYRTRAALKHLMRDISNAHPDWSFSKDVQEAARLGSPEEEETDRTSERTSQ